jgi:hypothetical protein
MHIGDSDAAFMYSQPLDSFWQDGANFRKPFLLQCLVWMLKLDGANLFLKVVARTAWFHRFHAVENRRLVAVCVSIRQFCRSGVP